MNSLPTSNQITPITPIILTSSTQDDKLNMSKTGDTSRESRQFSQNTKLTNESEVIPTDINIFSDSELKSSSISNQPFSAETSHYIMVGLLLFFFIWVIMRFMSPTSQTTSSESLPSHLSNILDFCVITFIISVWIGPLFFSTPSDRSQTFINDIKNIETFISTPASILALVVFIIFIYILSFLFSIPAGTDNKPITIFIIENIAWILLILSIITSFFKYILHIDFIHWLNNITGLDRFIMPTIAVPVSDIPDVSIIKSDTDKNNKNEVFNVGNNLYTYDDAEAICLSYDSTVATYDQVEEAYNGGGEWCNYGWSQGQMALFPTQKATWTKLQDNPEHKNNCGRPGINGGYIANPYIRFGVNCYGKKPDKSSNNSNVSASSKIYPQTAKDKVLQNKVDFWKENGDSLLTLNDFNNIEWSQIKLN